MTGEGRAPKQTRRLAAATIVRSFARRRTAAGVTLLAALVLLVGATLIAGWRAGVAVAALGAYPAVLFAFWFAAYRNEEWHWEMAPATSRGSRKWQIAVLGTRPDGQHTLAAFLGTNAPGAGLGGTLARRVRAEKWDQGVPLRATAWPKMAQRYIDAGMAFDGRTWWGMWRVVDREGPRDPAS